MFTLLIIVLIFILFSLLIVNNYNDVVLYSLNNNKFNGFKFPLI